MRTLSLKLPNLLDASLAAAARRRHTTKSAVVRDALASYLSRKDGMARGTFLDLARDLAGSVPGGPPGLSYEKKYLRDFGR